MNAEDRNKMLQFITDSGNVNVIRYKNDFFRTIKNKFEEGVMCRFYIRQKMSDFIYCSRIFYPEWEKIKGQYSNDDRDFILENLLKCFNKDFETLYIEKFKNNLMKPL